MKKFIRISALVFAILMVFAGCGDSNNSAVVSGSDAPSTDTNVTEYVPELVTLTFSSAPVTSGENADQSDEDASSSEDASSTEAVVSHPRVKFTMENGGSFIIELYPEYAPETCANFVKLVGEGFYDGLTFHRIIEGFMAQGGDPEGTGRGGSDEKIHGEFYANGFEQNVISHTRGVVSMARSQSYDSASSQFFICYDDCSYSLDGGYAAFGLVVEGMEVVDAFLDVERVYNGENKPSKPITPIVIEKAEVIA